MYGGMSNWFKKTFSEKTTAFAPGYCVAIEFKILTQKIKTCILKTVVFVPKYNLPAIQ